MSVRPTPDKSFLTAGHHWTARKIALEYRAPVDELAVDSYPPPEPWLLNVDQIQAVAGRRVRQWGAVAPSTHSQWGIMAP
jgi:hypothetical protein